MCFSFFFFCLSPQLWTNRNPEITALLKENGCSGVPLYLYYAPGAATPKVLPQILTGPDVLQAIGS